MLEGKKFCLVAHFHPQTTRTCVCTHICRFDRPAGLLIKLYDALHLGNNIDPVSELFHICSIDDKTMALERLIKDIKNSSHQIETERKEKKKINYVRVCLQKRRRRWWTTSFYAACNWIGWLFLFCCSMLIQIT